MIKIQKCEYKTVVSRKVGSNRPPEVILRDTNIVGDIHDYPSLGPGARKPARNKVTPLQCALPVNWLLVGSVLTVGG